MGKMQIAFEIYFSKLEEFSQKEFGSTPMISYDESMNKDLIFGVQDDEGYVPWLPKKIYSNFNFNPIEEKFNLCLTDEIKDYYTTYLFLSLSGSFQNIMLDFEPISEFSTLSATIERQINDARYYFPNEHYILIGSGSDGSDDSYNIFYDNKNPKLVCVSTETNSIKLINQPLSFIIQMMEVFE